MSFLCLFCWIFNISNCLTDNNYTVELSVYNLGPSGTCHKIKLTGIAGNVISSHETSQLRRDVDTLCAADFKMPKVVSLCWNNDIYLSLK